MKTEIEMLIKDGKAACIHLPDFEGSKEYARLYWRLSSALEVAERTLDEIHGLLQENSNAR